MKNTGFVCLFVLTLGLSYFTFVFYSEAKDFEENVEEAKQENFDERELNEVKIAKFKESLFALKETIRTQDENLEKTNLLEVSLREKNESLQTHNKRLIDENLSFQVKLAKINKALSKEETVVLEPEEPVEEKEEEKAEKNPMAEMMSKMMENEGMKDMVKMQIDQQFKMMWGDF